MGFSISLPVVGQPHSTEDPKVGNALSTISTWGNGQIVDTDINSPNNSYRRLLLQASSVLSNGTPTGFSYLMGGAGTQGVVAAGTSGSAVTVPMWFGDSGLSSQPTDFQVANKSAFARVRVGAVANATATATTFTFALNVISAVTGTGGNVTYTVGAALATAVMTSPGASLATGVESAQFALPTAASCYVLTVTPTGTPAAGSALMATAQLVAYNA